MDSSGLIPKSWLQPEQTSVKRFIKNNMAYSMLTGLDNWNGFVHGKITYTMTYSMENYERSTP